MSIQLEKVSKRYGSYIALTGVSLHVRRGEIFCLLGANGAGKTTIVHALCGLTAIDEGKISIHGYQVPEQARQARSLIGLCPQDLAIWENLTCNEQLAFVAGLYDIDTGKAEHRISALLERVGLLNHRHSLPAELSGGMKRLLNVILSIIHEPALIILDEPFTELDPYNRAMVRSMITQAAREQGKTVMVTSNDTHEIDAVADRIALIDDGSIVEVDTPDNLKARCPQKNATLEQAFIYLVEKRRQR